jgi:hypothetical protein
MIFPLISPLTIKLSLKLKASAVTDCFCFIVNTILDVLRLNMVIWPEFKPRATISIKGEEDIKLILLLSYNICFNGWE